MADRMIPVLDAAGELPARQSAESDFAALPALQAIPRRARAISVSIESKRGSRFLI
jgi:hypothetical protein